MAEGDGVGEGTSKKMELSPGSSLIFPLSGDELVRICAVVDVTEGDALGKLQMTLSSCSSANICTNLQDRKSFTHYMQLTMHYVLYITCTSSLTTQLKSSDWRNDPAPEVIAYALTRSFSHAIH